MFTEYFGLREQPFGVTPNPRYLYPADNHRQALAALTFSVQNHFGFAALVGGPGTGKTTLLFRLLETFQETSRTALVFTTQCNSPDFLRYLAAELGVPASQRDSVHLFERIRGVLLEEARGGRHVLVIVDEAQNLDRTVLETVRLLSDFETPERKLLDIILAGQPELDCKLRQSALRQLRQRIVVFSHLECLSEEETFRYIEHRLRLACPNAANLFTQDALIAIARDSRGVPRDINRICLASLIAAYEAKCPRVDATLVRSGVKGLQVETSIGNARRAEPIPLGPADIADRLTKSQTEHNTSRQVMAAHKVVSSAWGNTSHPQLADTNSFGFSHTKSRERPGSNSRHAWRTIKEVAPNWTAASMTAAMAAFAILFLYLPPGPRLAKSAIAEPARTTGTTSQKSTSALNVSSPQAQSQLPEGRYLKAPAEGAKPSGAKIGGLRNVPPPASTKADPYLAYGPEVRSEPVALPFEQPAAASLNAAPPNPFTGELEIPESRNVESVLALPTPVIPALAAKGQPGSQFRGGTLVKKVNPQYPEVAKVAKLEGGVLLKALISQEGEVLDIKVVSGSPILVRAAVDAVSQWRYQPYEVNGRPVPREVAITVLFRLSDQHP